MIREIEIDDKEIYIEMAEEFYHSEAVSHPVPAEHFEKAFDHIINDGTYYRGYMFEHDCVTCGFCSVSITYSQEAGGQVICIEDLYIRPEYRGKGIGSRIFERISRDFPDAARYRLEVTETNKSARKLYERMGFEVLPYVQMIREL